MTMKARNIFASLPVILALLLPLTASAQEDEGWRESPWFGSYYQMGDAPSWVFREGFNWGYAFDDPSGSSAWLSVPGFGFIWSGQGTWPWFYSTDADGWVYADPNSSDPSYFYESPTRRWRVGPTQFPSVSSLSAMDFTPFADVPEPFPLGNLFAITESLSIQDTKVKVFGGVQVRELAAAESANIRMGQTVQIRAFIDESKPPFGPDISTFLNFTRGNATFSMGVESDEDSLRVSAWQGGFGLLGRMPTAVKDDDAVAMNLYSGSFRDSGDYSIRFGFVAGSTVLTPLDTVSLRVNRNRTSVLEGDVVVDTGFRPNPDGMGFENFGDIRDSDLTEDDIRLLLGDLAV